jgi:tetratricopeptide (TPR) repeat protein
VSKATMRRSSAFVFASVVAAVASSACAPARSSVSPLPHGIDTPARLAKADALVRAGCYDCLVEAFREFEQLVPLSPASDAARAGAARAAGLLAIRERELGMVDSGYLALAKDRAARASDSPAWVTRLLDALDLLPGAVYGVSHPPATDAELQRSIEFRRSRESYAALLREQAPTDELAAYAWTTFMCGSVEARDVTIDEIFMWLPLADSQLLRFRRATCRGLDQPGIERVLADDSRFGELPYLLGLAAVGRRDLDGAQPQFERAYAWHARWPSLTQSLGALAMTAEDFETAARFYDEATAAEPRLADAQLGKIRALTYLGRHQDAMAAADALLDLRWYPGDAYYWRALNEAQLERYEDAWRDIEEAARYQRNAEVPKLAGIIAYRRQQLEVAAAQFAESRARNLNDCETGFYLGVVRAEQREWVETADVLAATAACFQQAEDSLAAEIESIRSSTSPPERRARQIARRERDIANGRRMLATSWFDAAVACFTLARTEEARRFAERVADDQQYGDRAREILSRLK